MDIRAVLCSPLPHIISRVTKDSARDPIFYGDAFTPCLRRDDAFFRHLAGLLQRRLSTAEPGSCPPVPLEHQLRPIVSVTDTRMNFSSAVLEPVMFALNKLTGRDWSFEAGQDQTDDDVLCDGNRIGTISLVTHYALHDREWEEIDAYIDGKDSQLPQDDARERAISLLCHVWTASERTGRSCAFALSSYLGTMFFYRAAGSDILRCSRMHRCTESGKHAVRFMLVATLLVAASDLRQETKVPTSFRQISPEYESLGGLDGRPTKRAKVSSIDNKATPSEMFTKKHILTIRSDLTSLPMPLAAFSRAADDGATPDHPEKIVVPPDTEADIVIREVMQYTRIGFVARGDAHGVCVFIKYCEEAEKWTDLVDEVRTYISFERAGFADFIPPMYGMWYDDAYAFLVVGDAGYALEEWKDLNEIQWDLFTRRLHALHESGFHHGDLEPRNVCVDLDGCVRLIDLGSAEECSCRKHPWHTECSEMATLRMDSQREICFDTCIHVERS